MAEAPSTAGVHTTPPNHLGTDVPTGHLDEKKDYGATDPTKIAPSDEEEEDEDMDALIEELESQDQNIDEEEEETAQPGGARNVPEELLQTSTRDGLNSQEVLSRRKKFGMNQMKEEKENLILKFLGFFIGPIQFVMEVSCQLFFPYLFSLCFSSCFSSCSSCNFPLTTSVVARKPRVTPSIPHILTQYTSGRRRPRCRSSGLGRFRCHLRLVVA
jgi:hypothetical protein